jgi:hypothetical protein
MRERGPAPKRNGRSAAGSQRQRREQVRAGERDVHAQVVSGEEARDDHCWMCGRSDRLTLQHVDPRGMGGKSTPVSAEDAIALCGSGTTGCHGTVELQGRFELVSDGRGGRIGWAYFLGYLRRDEAEQPGLLAAPTLVWDHFEQSWFELFPSGVKTRRAWIPRPPDEVLDRVEDWLPPERFRPRRPGPPPGRAPRRS